MAAASESNVTAKNRIGAEIVSQRAGGCRVSWGGEFFRIKPSRFPQVRDRFLKSLTLADDADLGTLGNIPRFFLVHHGSVGLNRHN